MRWWFAIALLLSFFVESALGANLTTNPEFTSNTTGWSGVRATITRADYTSTPDIDPTGGTDNFGVTVESTNNLGQASSAAINCNTGDKFLVRARAYSPSTNTDTNIARLHVASAAFGFVAEKAITVEDQWQTIAMVVTAVDNKIYVYLRNSTAVVGSITYWDSISITSITFSSTQFYIDPDCAEWGDGLGQSCAVSTGASGAFKNFEAVNIFTGDLGNSGILLKRGTKIREKLALTSATDFNVSNYGSGDLPIIDGSDVISDTWIAEGDLWYIEGQTHNRAIFVDDVQMMAVELKASLAEGKQWYDSVNSRIYIQAASNPNTVTVEANSSARTHCIVISAAADVTVSGIRAQRGYTHNISSENTGNNVTITECESIQAGCWNDCGGGVNGIVVYGDDVSPPTGTVISDNITHHNQNCGIEVWGLNGVVISGNTIYENGNGIELWGYISNAVIKNNTIYDIFNDFTGSISPGHKNGIWATKDALSSPDTGNHSGNSVYYNLMYNIYSAAMSLDNGTGWTVVNNTFHSIMGGAAAAVELGYRGDGAEFVDIVYKNNIILVDDATITNFLLQVTATTFTADNNIYFWSTGATPLQIKINGTDYTTLAGYKIGLNPEEQNSIATSPLLNIDYSPLITSPAIYTGADVSLTSDIVGKPIRGATPNMGAYESWPGIF